jgi:effector-binding domain-containing protein
MKLKGCLTGLGLLLIVLLGISFFLPKDMNLKVTKQLNASPEQVFAQVNNLKNWEHWDPWKSMDPDMEITYGATWAGPGGSYTWKSDKKGMGNGALFIDESVKNEKVATTIKFEGMDDGHGTILISPSGDGSSVTWDFSSDYAAKWPWQRYMTTVYRAMLARQYGKGLASIESYVAANPEAHLNDAGNNTGSSRELVVSEKEMAPFQGVSVNRKGLIADMEKSGHAIYSQAFEEVNKKISEQGLSISGMPFAQAISWDEEAGTYELEIGLPVAGGGQTYGGGRVVMASYYGPYEGTGEAHGAIDAYCQEKGLEVRGAPWEIYANDPGDFPDPADWLTEIYYPVK